MDALRRSLGQASSSPGKPAKKSRKASSGQKEIADAHRGQEGRQANGGQETCVQAAAQVGLGQTARKELRMIKGRRLMRCFAVLATLVCLGAKADAAQCGSTPAGFENWKREFADEARSKGIGATAVTA
jgi:hypothetical protein